METSIEPFAHLSWTELSDRLEMLKHLDRTAATVQPEVDRDRLIRELQMHQIELEMQNRELRESEQRVEASRARYAELYDQAPVGYVTLDAAGTVLAANLTAATLFGYPRELLAGAPFAAAARVQDAGAFRAHLRECVSSGRRLTVELECRGPDDAVMIVQLATIAERAPARLAAASYHMTITDLTESRRARAEKEQLASERRARLAADEANRMKDQFLGIVSHELRTPLNAILGWTQMAKSRPDDREVIVRAVDVLLRNAKTLARIVDDILDVSRIVNGKLQVDLTKTDFAEAVRAALDLARPAAIAKGVDLRESVCTEAPLRGDPVRLEQVVSNLISNAVKFTRPGGCVEVTLERADHSLHLTVADDGCGIDARDLPHVFESFRQADSSTTRSHSGLGLGLAIAQHIVLAHGGEITAKSDGIGLGTTVTVDLPPASFSTPPPRPPSRPQVADALSLEGVRVLFIDDEVAARDLAELVLGDYGAIVETADSVDGALARLQTFTPDVVVSDIAMPVRDGHDFIRAVRRLPAPVGRVPAIALTAYARAEDAEQAMEAGFSRHLPKPVASDALAAMIFALSRRS